MKNQQRRKKKYVAHRVQKRRRIAPSEAGWSFLYLRVHRLFWAGINRIQSTARKGFALVDGFIARKLSPRTIRRIRRQWLVRIEFVQEFVGPALDYIQRILRRGTHRLGHVVMVGAQVVVICTVIIGSFASGVPVYAGTTNYDFGVSGDYTFDSATTEITSNQARLKSQQYATDANTKALWHFDESSGTTASDISGNGNVATLSTSGGCSSTFSTGKVNNGLNLNGSPTCVTAPDSPSLSLSSQMTLEAFTKFSSAFDNTNNAIQGVVGKGNYKLYFDRNDGRLKFDIDDQSAKTWDKVAGSIVGNGSWDENLPRDVTNAVEYNSELYVTTGGILTVSAGQAEVWKYSGSGTTWTKVGGDGINSSWADNTYEHAPAMTVFSGNLYVGLGTTAGDAEVWKYNGSTWAKVGGDSANSSWGAGYETVRSFAQDGTVLYAGLGDSANDSEVWRYNGSTWTKIGGDGGGSPVSWNTSYEQVVSMVTSGTTLYVGLGVSAGDAEVWRCSNCQTATTGTASWGLVGGDAVNTSWANSTYEQVWSLAANGTTIYAGLGDTASEAEVWACASCDSSPSWSQIGGDTVNSWNTGFERVYALTYLSGNLYAALGNSANDAEVWRYSGSGNTWTKIGGDAVNSSWQYNKENSFVGTFNGNLVVGTGGQAEDAEVWTCTSCDATPTWSWIGGRDWNSWGAVSMAQVQSMAINNGKLFVGFAGGNKFAVVWEYNGTTWRQIGGGTINNSWDESIEGILTLASYNNNLYAGTGTSANDAEVWKYNGSTWTQIGGDSLNSGWTTNYDYANSLVVSNGNLFVGLGITAGEAEVWRWNDSSWAKIGGDGVGLAGNLSWVTSYETIRSMLTVGTDLYVGLGDSAGDAELYRCNNCDTATSSTAVWAKIGGDAVNSSWANTTYEQVNALAALGTTIFVGLGTTAGDAEVWRCDSCNTGSPVWTRVDNDGVAGSGSGSWSDLEFEQVLSMVTYNGELYVGLGNSANDSEIWKCANCESTADGASAVWDKIAGDNTNSAWGANFEAVNNMTVYDGKLYAGLGNTGVGSNSFDGQVWVYGNTHVLASAKSSWDTNWHHVAATYDGTFAKIYVDGIQDGVTANWGALTLADLGSTLYIGSITSPFDNSAPLVGFNGQLDEVRISNIARTSFTLNQYPTSVQTIRAATAIPRDDILAWSGFSTTETLNGGSITYRLSDDNGVSWKYWSGASWATSNSTGLANVASVLNANVGTFPVTDSGILWQAIVSGNGDQQVILNSVDVSYTDDTTDPVNPDTGTAKDQVGGAVSLTSTTWYNYAAPEFSWTGATDTAGSGIRGYYVYFGTSASADPVSAGTFQAGSTYVPSNMSSGSTYYLRIKAKDYANNVAATAFDAFTYKYDSTAPTGPSTVSVSPSGYTSVNNYQFFWPASGTGSATDLGAPTTGSGVAGYQYKLPTGTVPLNDWSTTITDTSVTIPNAATAEGPNTFELRTVDNAGNYGATVTATFYYAGSAPSFPQNLTVTPTTSVGSPAVNNSFAFAWEQPEFFNGSIKQYYYSINKTPTSTNTSSTTQRSLVAAPYATQQGKNTFYVVAEDEAGNKNFNDPATINFYTQTPAPEMPTALQIFDISNRDTQEYAISMKWTEPVKAAGFDGYQIQRSEDNVTFSDAGTTKSPVFIDTNLQSKVYYFRIRSQDNAGQVSAFSSVVNLTPTGRFTSPPKLLDGPTVIAKSFSAAMTWTTDRASSSFVEYGIDKDKIGKENGGDTVGQLDQVTSHAVALKGLEPETIYYYRVVWVDQDGNRGQSDLLSFTTGLRPKISDVKIANITLTSADISWISTTVASSTINFGTTRTFGQSLSDVSGSQTTKHTLRLDNLSDATTYYFVITGKDVDENSLTSDEYSFTTLTRPRIDIFVFETVKDSATTAIKFAWQTNVPTTSIVSYALTGQTAKTKSAAEYATDHEMIIDSLADNTGYTLQVKGVDQFGNTTQSDSNNFTTPDDSRPPKVSNMTIEVRSSGVGAAQKAQLVVSWETDEPSGSQVEYGPGISSESYPSRTQEDTVLTNNHVVIVPELEPAKLYHLRAVSRDRANNAGTSADTTSITGKVQRSVIDIIIGSLQRSLGFLSAIPGFGR